VLQLRGMGNGSGLAARSALSIETTSSLPDCPENTRSARPSQRDCCLALAVGAGRLLAARAAWWKKLAKHRRALLASLCGVLELLAFRWWGSHRIGQVEVGIVLSLG